MTRPFRQQTKCPHCGKLHDAETSMNRWVRRQRSLDSVESGLVRFDGDMILHRYKGLVDGLGGREIQCLMFVEVKNYGAEISDQQRDTLGIFNQCLRNRRGNIHSDKKGRHVKDHTPLAKAWSHWSKRDVRIRLFGGHLLTLSGSDPDDSEWMTWDAPSRRITTDQLLGLLHFDLDPDSWPLHKFDWRRRYRSKKVPDLFNSLEDLTW